MPPHVFSAAQMAYRDLLNTRRDQSLVFVGRSGAGKTMSSLHCLHYLLGAAGSVSNIFTGQGLSSSSPFPLVGCVLSTSSLVRACPRLLLSLLWAVFFQHLHWSGPVFSFPSCGLCSFNIFTGQSLSSSSPFPLVGCVLSTTSSLVRACLLLSLLWAVFFQHLHWSGPVFVFSFPSCGLCSLNNIIIGQGLSSPFPLVGCVLSTSSLVRACLLLSLLWTVFFQQHHHWSGPVLFFSFPSCGLCSFNIFTGQGLSSPFPLVDCVLSTSSLVRACLLLSLLWTVFFQHLHWSGPVFSFPSCGLCSFTCPSGGFVCCFSLEDFDVSVCVCFDLLLFV